MKLPDLQNAVRALAVVAESEAPFVSCYADLEGDPRKTRAELSDRVLTIRASLEPDQRVESQTRSVADHGLPQLTTGT